MQWMQSQRRNLSPKAKASGPMGGSTTPTSPSPASPVKSEGPVPKSPAQVAEKGNSPEKGKRVKEQTLAQIGPRSTRRASSLKLVFGPLVRGHPEFQVFLPGREKIHCLLLRGPFFCMLENCQVEKPSWHVQPTTPAKKGGG